MQCIAQRKIVRLTSTARKGCVQNFYNFADKKITVLEKWQKNREMSNQSILQSGKDTTLFT